MTPLFAYQLASLLVIYFTTCVAIVYIKGLNKVTKAMFGIFLYITLYKLMTFVIQHRARLQNIHQVSANHLKRCLDVIKLDSIIEPKEKLIYMLKGE